MKQATFTGANVVPIWQYKTMATHDIENEVLDYWQELCSGRPMPLRSEIDPTGLEGALENAFVAERTQTGLVRLRVAGSKLNKSMNMDTRGMPISSFFDPQCRQRVKTELTKVFTKPAILRISTSNGNQEDELNSPYAQGSWLILPLKGQEGFVDRAMGTYIVSGNPTVPFRPMIDTVDVTRIEVPEGYFKTPVPAKQNEMAEESAPFWHRPRHNQTNGHKGPNLRLVHSRD